MTCLLCKIYEGIIKADIENFIAKFDLFGNFQHGFLKSKSTATDLIQSVNNWSIGVNERKCTRVVSADFAKAFNSVSTNKLIYKLNCLGLLAIYLTSLKAQDSGSQSGRSEF